MRKVLFVLTSLILLGVITFIIIAANSFSMALRRGGFDSEFIITHEACFDDNGNEFRIIETTGKDGKEALVHLFRNKVGIWSIRGTSGANNEYFWVRTAGFKGYRVGEFKYEMECNFLYIGSNAINPIEFLPGQLPKNVAVNIRQNGSNYSIHLIFFDSSKSSSPSYSFDFQELLREAGCIPTA